MDHELFQITVIFVKRAGLLAQLLAKLFFSKKNKKIFLFKLSFLD
jgi:hypothetical protein